MRSARKQGKLKHAPPLQHKCRGGASFRLPSVDYFTAFKEAVIAKGIGFGLAFS